MFTFTIGTAMGFPLSITTIMAAQGLIGEMKRQGNITMGTLGHISAGTTHYKSGKTTPIH
ncbi:MAG TPA: hypothetical protein DDY49_07890 [Paenibacillaceae bacterium]|nr:hypothetical protein [Paenibacillaceae bacterium]